MRAIVLLTAFVGSEIGSGNSSERPDGDILAKIRVH